MMCYELVCEWNSITSGGLSLCTFHPFVNLNPVLCEYSGVTSWLTNTCSDILHGWYTSADIQYLCLFHRRMVACVQVIPLRTSLHSLVSSITSFVTMRRSTVWICTDRHHYIMPVWEETKWPVRSFSPITINLI